MLMQRLICNAEKKGNKRMLEVSWVAEVRLYQILATIQ